MFAGRNEKVTDDDIVFYCMISYWEPLIMQLPVLPDGRQWFVEVNTNVEYKPGEDFMGKTEMLGVTTMRVPPRTTIILTSKKY